MSLLDTASLIVTPNGYKEGKLYSVIPSDGSGDLSVTRATTATRVNSQGLVESMGNNIPRLDYSNGTCPSILVEPQRTNVLTYSSSFDNGAWVKATAGTGSLPVVTANSTISPSGIQDADTIVLNAGGGTTPSDQSQIYQLYNVTAGTTYTMSFYAKGAVGGEQIMIRQAGLGSYTKITLTNEWKRYTLTETAPLTIAASVTFIIRRGLNEPINASATFYLWGAQLEAGSYATSYIPTTSASVTRNADEVSKSGISALIGQTEGTAFIDFDFNSKVTSNGIMAFSIDGGAGNEMYILIYSNGNIVWEMYNGGLAQGSITGNIGTYGRKKISLTYKANDCALYVNGTQIGTDTTATIPAMNRVYLGRFYSSTAYNMSSGINSFILWKTRLTNTQLAQLTAL